MLAYKCKSLYVLWNRIIIVLIYQPRAVPRDGWEVLAKVSTSSKRTDLLNYTKGVGIIRDASVYEICFLLEGAWGLHLIAGWNVITSPLVMSEIKVYRDVIESVTWGAHKGNFFPSWVGWIPLKSLGDAFPGRTQAFWDTEQNVWIVQNFKSIVPNKEFSRLNKLQLTYFPCLKTQIGKLSSIEVNDETLTGTKVSPIKSNDTLWLQLWNLWLTLQGFVCIFFLSNCYLKQAHYHV